MWSRPFLRSSPRVLSSLAVLLLDLVLGAPTRAAPVDPMGVNPKDRVVTREELNKPVPRSPLFRSREEAAKLPVDRTPTSSAPLPQAWPPEAEEEDPDHLRREWEKRISPEEFQKRIGESLAMPSEEQVSRPAAVDPVWAQVGLGITHPDGIHHRAGRIRQVTYAFDDSQGTTVLWAGATGGGLWKVVWLGFFGVWVPVSDTLPGSPAVGAFLVDTLNSSRILIGTGDSYRYTGSGMYRTLDGGRSWTLTSLTPIPAAFQKIIADRSNSNTVLASGDGGIWRSLDFGENWSQVYMGATSDLVQDPAFPSYWYAGAPGIGILESSTSGLSFHTMNCGSGSGNGNCDGGTGIMDPVGRVSLTVCDAATQYVYALVENGAGGLGGVYRSVNYGMDWTPIDSVDTIGWGQGSHTNAIAVDPTTPDRLFVGMGGAQWTANARGVTPCWTRNSGTGCTGCSSICVDGGHADFTSFLFVPQAMSPGNTSVLMTNDGGYYLYDWSANSINGMGNLLGLSAEQTMQPHGSLAGARLDPDLLLSGTQDNSMVRIDKNASDELRALGGGDGGQASISPDNNNDFFFSSGLDYYRYYSINQGTDWLGVSCSLATDWAATVLREVSPGLGSPKMFTHSGQYLWYKPISTTCNWAQVNPSSPLPGGFNMKQIEESLAARFVFYATGWNSDRLYVFDGGSLGSMTWVDRTPPLPVGSTRNDSMVFADRSTLQPCTAYYTTASARPARAFLSTSCGVGWTDVTGDLTTLLPSANYWELIGNPSNLNQLFLATDVGVFRSDNRGAHWYRYSSGLPRVVSAYGIELNYDNASPPLLHIGSYGRGWWERRIAPVTHMTGSADYSGDGADEIGVFRNGMWFLSYSPDHSGVDLTRAFGSPVAGRDSPEIGEFNCLAAGGSRPDGQPDLGIWRKPTSNFQATLSTDWGSAPDLNIAFGATTHKKLAVRRLDTNGDGCSDIGVFRNGCFDILESPAYNTASPRHVCFGLGTDEPLGADLDGDGRSDLILWRAASAHYTYRLSSEGYASDHGADLGAGDYPLVGDVSGDGRADLGSYKAAFSTFRFTYSPDFVGVDLTKTHGLSGDIPLVADVNGDEVSDLGIFRNAFARWWFKCAPGWTADCVSLSFGQAGDIPIYGKPPGMP